MFEVTEPKPELRASKPFHCVRDVKHVARQFILYGPFTEHNSSTGCGPVQSQKRFNLKWFSPLTVRLKKDLPYVSGSILRASAWR